MLTDTFIGKPLKSLPSDTLKAPIASIAEVETTSDLNDKVERLKQSLRQSTRTRYLIIALRV